MAEGIYYAIVSLADEIVAVELEDMGGEPDVWRDLEAFDEREGTNLYNGIDQRDVLEVTCNLSSSPYIPACIIRTARDIKGLLRV